MDRFAIAMLAREKSALVKERADVRRIETKDARERVHRVLAAVECNQRFAERDERVEVIRIALEQIDEEIERLRRLSESPLQHRQRERGVGVRGNGVERGN